MRREACAGGRPVGSSVHGEQCPHGPAGASQVTAVYTVGPQLTPSMLSPTVPQTLEVKTRDSLPTLEEPLLWSSASFHPPDFPTP